MSKSENKNYTTPRAVVAGYTAIQEPSLNYNKDANEYKIRVAMDAAKAASFIKDMEALRDAHFEKVLDENPKLRKVLQKADIGTVEYDDDGEETGRILFSFKQKSRIEYVKKDGTEGVIEKKVALFDGKGKRVKKKLRIGTGSEVQVSFEPNPYYTAKDKEVGISFNRLQAVLLLKYVEYAGGEGGSAEDYGFDPDDDEDAFSADDFDSDDVNDSDDADGDEVQDF